MTYCVSVILIFIVPFWYVCYYLYGACDDDLVLLLRVWVLYRLVVGMP